MMNETTFLIDQQRRRHTGNLHSWVLRVRSARNCEDALRIAYNRPTPSSLLAGVRSLIASDERRFSQEVEASLQRRLGAGMNEAERWRCAQIAIRLIWAPSLVRWARAVRKPGELP